MQSGLRKILECFRVELIHAPEAAKLSLSSIKIPMMILIRSHQFRLANVIDHFHFLDNLHREWKLCNPGRAVGLILKEVSGRGRIAHPCRRSHVVAHFGKDIRLDGATKIKSFVITLRLSRKVVAPEERSGAGSEDIRKLNGVHVAYGWSPRYSLPFTPFITRLIEAKMDLVEVHVYEVGATGSVQVSQKETFGIKVDLQLRRVLHCYAFAKVAIAKVGPVIDAAVM